MKFLSSLSFLAIITLVLQSPLHSRSEFSPVIDTKTLERDSQFTPHSYATILKEAKSAVVSVHTANIIKVVQSQGLSPQEEMLRRFFGYPVPPNRGQVEPKVEERRLPQGIGSGVIISADGYIITNNHVVSSGNGEDADEILVRLNDGRDLQAEIIGRDVRTDVALLKVEATNLPAMPVADSDTIEVGDIVFAIGNPMEVGLTVTQGIVSATGRSIGIYGAEGYENFIQTDASINPGNSGGALVDTLGRLIGINSAILSRTGGNIGIGFAIPSNLAINISRQLDRFGEVKRSLIGVNISTLTRDMAEAFGIDEKFGVVIDKVEEGYPAEKAGIKRGDVVIAIDSKPVRTANALRIKVGQTPPGTDLTFTVFRDGERKNIVLKTEDQTQLTLFGGELFEGVQVTPLTQEDRELYTIPEKVTGLVVVTVDPISGFARYFRPGMVIIEINDQNVDSIENARKLLSKSVNKLYVYDRGRVSYIAVRK